MTRDTDVKDVFYIFIPASFLAFFIFLIFLLLKGLQNYPTRNHFEWYYTKFGYLAAMISLVFNHTKQRYNLQGESTLTGDISPQFHWRLGWSRIQCISVAQLRTGFIARFWPAIFVV